MANSAPDHLFEDGPDPFNEPGATLFVRPEECRKCPSRVLVTYLVDSNGETCGWRTEELGPCGNPDRCGEKVRGVAPEQILGCWLCQHGACPGGRRK